MDGTPNVILNYILTFCDTKSLINMSYLNKRTNKEVKKVSFRRIDDKYPNFFDKNLYRNIDPCKSPNGNNSPQYFYLMQKDNNTKDNEKCRKQSWWKRIDWIYAQSLFERIEEDLNGTMDQADRDDCTVIKKSEIMSRILVNILRDSARDKNFTTKWKRLIHNTNWKVCIGKIFPNERRTVKRVIEIKLSDGRFMCIQVVKKTFPSNNHHDNGCRKLSLKCKLGEHSVTFSGGIKQITTMTDMFLFTSDSERHLLESISHTPTQKVLDKLDFFSYQLFGAKTDYSEFCKFLQLVMGRNKSILREIESKECVASEN